MRWRVYRLPGSREWWLIDHGPRTLVFSVKAFSTEKCTARSEQAPNPNAVPRAWLGILASDLYVSGQSALFKGAELMYLRTVSNVTVTKLGNVRPGAKIHLQVLTANVTVCFGDRPDTLLTPEPFSGQQGMQFDSTAGVVEIVWQSGEVWAIGLSTNGSNPVVNFDGGQYS